MRDRNSVIAIYRNHEEASGAVRSAIQCGLDRGSLSIVARDRLAGGCAVIDDHSDGSAASWTSLGTSWGGTSWGGTTWGGPSCGKLGVVGPNLWGPGLWGMVMGWVSIWMPGLGPLLMGGPMVPLMLGPHDGAAVFGSLTPLGVGLYRIGVPKGGVRRYEEAIRRGRYLLVIQGSPDQVIRAGRLLSGTAAEVVALHAHWSAGAVHPAARLGMTKVIDGSRPTGAVHPFPTPTGGNHDDSSPLSDAS